MRKKNKKLIVVLFVVVFLFLRWQVILADFLNGDFTPDEPPGLAYNGNGALYEPPYEQPYWPLYWPPDPPPPPANSPDSPFWWTPFWLAPIGKFIWVAFALFTVFVAITYDPPAPPDDPPLPPAPPSAINLSVSQPSCYPWGTSPQPTLSWTFSDPDYNDYQTAYQAQIDNNSDFSSPEVDSGNVSSGANSYTVPAGKLNYSTLYYWRVMVWDKHNVNSAWANSSFTTSPFCNNPPSVTNLRAQVFPNPAECAVPYPGARLSWTFTDPDPGDTQSAYRVQVDNNSNFSSPEIDTGKIISFSNSYATPSGKLFWNTTYYWRLMVWDRANASSAWISGPSFTTPLHAYPFIDFSWLPERPTVNEIVQFTDRSVVFGGTTKVSWSWTFQDAIPSSSNQQNPSVKFTSTGPKIVTLKVTDSNGFSCTGQKTISARLPLPEWREIPPTIWLKKIFARPENFFRELF